MSGIPELVGLCPDPGHTAEFYMPLDHGESLVCPLDDCERRLVIYERLRTEPKAKSNHPNRAAEERTER